jgi:hypothetical protein
VDFTKCTATSSDATCQWILNAVAITDGCRTLESKSTCEADQACEWKSSSTCGVSTFGVILAMQRAGSPLGAALIAQEQACNKINGKDACLAVPLPAGTGSSSGGSRPAGSGAVSPMNGTAAGATKSGAGAALLPSLLLALLAPVLLALAAVHC